MRVIIAAAAAVPAALLALSTGCAQHRGMQSQEVAQAQMWEDERFFEEDQEEVRYLEEEGIYVAEKGGIRVEVSGVEPAPATTVREERRETRRDGQTRELREQRQHTAEHPAGDLTVNLRLR